MQKHKKGTNFDEIKIKPKTLAIASLIVLLVAFITAVFLAYGTKTSVGIRVRAIFSEIIPAPAAIINYRYFVLLGDLERNLSSVQKFYATQDLSQTGLRVDFSTPDGQKRLEIKRKNLLQKMIEDKVIEIIANKKGISISQEQAGEIVNQKLQELGTADEVKKNLLDSYGWTIDDFKKQVVLPGMYKDALNAYFDQHDSNTAHTKELAEKAKSELDGG
jgi:parvulin-like peptidyl-prolyl isomerase